MQPLQSFYQEEFNHWNSQPMHKWLSPKMDEGHWDDRMKVLGNLVVPACAALAANMLHAATSAAPLS